MTTIFSDPVFGYSIEIPEAWKHNSQERLYNSSNGLLILSLAGQSEIRISCAQPGNEIPVGKVARSVYYKRFLENTKHAISNALIDVVTQISGKDNSVRVELSTKKGYAGIISVFHGGIEYLIQYNSINSNRHQLESIISAFCFTGFNAKRISDSKEIFQLISALDSTNEKDRQHAKEKLIQIGSSAVSSIISSVNSCTQEITIALMKHNYAETQIASLRRRIQILSELKSLEGVNAIIQAIGDSVQVRDISIEAAKLFDTAKEGLIKAGDLAVGKIQKALELPGPKSRQVLVDVLEEIGTPNSIKALRQLASDPDPYIQEAINRVTGIFNFKIEKLEAQL